MLGLSGYLINLSETGLLVVCLLSFLLPETACLTGLFDRKMMLLVVPIKQIHYTFKTIYRGGNNHKVLLDV